MSNNITTLILNLLISENILHRIRISHKISELLESNVFGFGALETIMRNHFLSRIQNYVESPSGSNRDVLFEMADFYKMHFIEFTSELSIAA